MNTFDRAVGWRLVAMLLGLPIGLLAMVEAHGLFDRSSYYAISGGLLVAGLVVTIAFAGVVALWLRYRTPGGEGWRRVAGFDAGMIGGALAGWVLAG